MPSPPGKSSRSPVKQKKLFLLPVLTGTVLSCGTAGLLSWKGFIFPERPPFSLSLEWWLQSEHGAGTGLAVMTAVIIGTCLAIANRKRMGK